MKRMLTIGATALLVLALQACSGSVAPSDISAAVSTPPILIERQMLFDAIWGEGNDIPQDVACLAGSQFIFDAMKNPFMIAINSGTDSHYTSPVVVTGSLTIMMTEGDASVPSEACAAGNLKYLVSASPMNPIDIDVSGEDCPDIATIATAEGVYFPAAGSVTAHFEPHEVVASISAMDMNNTAGEETTDSATETGNPDEQQTQEEGQSFRYMEKMIKLVIDSCTGVDAAVDVTVE